MCKEELYILRHQDTDGIKFSDEFLSAAAEQQREMDRRILKER